MASLSRLIVLVTALCVAIAGSAAYAEPKVLGARYGAHPDKDRIVLDLSEVVKFRTRVAAGSRQVVLETTAMTWPFTTSNAPGSLKHVSRLRTDGANRVVIELSSPGKIAKVFVLAPSAGKNARLVIDIAPASAAEVAAAGGKAKPKVAAKAPETKKQKKKVAAKPKPVEAPTKKAAEKPAQKAERKAAAKAKVDATASVRPKLQNTKQVIGTDIPSTPPAVPKLADVPVNIAPTLSPLRVELVKAAAVPSTPPTAPPSRPLAMRAPDERVLASPLAAIVGEVERGDLIILESPLPPVRPYSSADMRPLLIAIDPGHGGIDPGAVRGSTQEKEVVLGFSKKLARRLTETGRYRVILTRELDVFLSLRDRVERVRAAGADLLISVHADTVKEQDANGASVYLLSQEASDAEAAALAEQENRSDRIAGIDLEGEKNDVARVLIDLAQSETMVESRRLGEDLVVSLREHGVTLRSRPLRSAGFRVLKAPDTPSILLEIGFMSNEADRQNMLSNAWRDQMIDGAITAIDRWARSRAVGLLARR